MSIIHAIYENGVFKPKEPVDLPDKAEVEFEVKQVRGSSMRNDVRDEQERKELFEILSRSYDTGQTDTAARHNEHHP
jgi:predicted DNA-binding antitoxin AbrB/MazE fold protein